LLIALSPTEEWLAITGDLAARIDQQSAFLRAHASRLT